MYYEIIIFFLGIDNIYLNISHWKTFADQEGHLDDRFVADVSTLIFHEFMHKIPRLLFDDVNFSTPRKIVDSSIPYEDRESGRLAELALFGCQPDWKSDLAKNTARQFRQAMISNEPLNLNFLELKTFERSYPFLRMAIDMIPSARKYD